MLREENKEVNMKYIIESSNYQTNIGISLKKLYFVIHNLKQGDNIPNILYNLQTTNKKAAKLMLKILKVAIGNVKNECKQKGFIFTENSNVFIEIGRSKSYKRQIFRAKGRVNMLEKYRSNIRVIIKTIVIKKNQEELNG